MHRTSLPVICLLPSPNDARRPSPRGGLQIMRLLRKPGDGTTWGLAMGRCSRTTNRSLIDRAGRDEASRLIRDYLVGGIGVRDLRKQVLHVDPRQQSFGGLFEHKDNARDRAPEKIADMLWILLPHGSWSELSPDLREIMKPIIERSQAFLDSNSRYCWKGGLASDNIGWAFLAALVALGAGVAAVYLWSRIAGMWMDREWAQILSQVFVLPVLWLGVRLLRFSERAQARRLRRQLTTGSLRTWPFLPEQDRDPSE